MLSKHSVKKFWRQGNFLTCNLARCLCWTRKVIHLQENTLNNTCKGNENAWHLGHQHGTFFRDKKLSLEGSDDRINDRSNMSEKQDSDTLSVLKRTHRIANQINQNVENSSMRWNFIVKGSKVLNTHNALLSCHTDIFSHANTILNARHFHVLRHTNFSIHDPNSLKQIDNKDEQLNHDSERKSEEKTDCVEKINSFNEISNESLIPGTDSDKLSSISGDTCQNSSDYQASSYILTDKYEDVEPGLFMEASRDEHEMAKFDKDNDECLIGKDQELTPDTETVSSALMAKFDKDNDECLISKDQKLTPYTETVSNALMESSSTEQELTTERTNRPDISILEELIREKENLEMPVPYVEERHPIFPGLPVIKTETDVAAAHETDLTNFDPKKGQKVAFPEVYHLAPLVNQSEVLIKLVQLGVDLTQIERKGMASHVIKMDFKKDLKPYLLFLHDIGVPDDKLGRVLTMNPSILKEDIEILRTRIDYFKSKKFKREEIVRMVIVKSNFLCVSTERVDEKLGFYQKHFDLKGSEVRALVALSPRHMVVNTNDIKMSKLQMSKYLGFTEQDLKKILLGFPNVYTRYFPKVRKTFDILHNTMEIPHHLIAMWPKILDSHISRIEQRHRFLLKVGRAQYDPKKENYVSLQRLTETVDEDFCVDVAKATVAEYYQFLKAI